MGQYVLVQIDKYYRYPVAEIIKSTSGKTIITKLNAIFVRHEIAYTFKLDKVVLKQKEEQIYNKNL